jgi:5'-nucleotidase
MSLESWIAVIGGVAALCTTVAFAPQIVKTRQTGGADLSYGMLTLYLTGVALWLAYGLLTGARAVVVANAATAVLVSVLLFVKLTAGRRGPASELRRLRIAIDMDETITDSLGKHLRLYNETFGENVTPAALAGRSLEDFVPAERAQATQNMVLEPTFFRDLAFIADSREVVRELAATHDVFIATAAMEVPTSFAAKYAWLREHLPFIPPSHIVFCGDKGVLDTDYLIDDTPRHFAHYRGTPILFSAPHNSGETRYLRAKGWREVRALLLQPRPSAPAAVAGIKAGVLATS